MSCQVGLSRMKEDDAMACAKAEESGLPLIWPAES